MSEQPKRCRLCGHQMTFDKCGSAEADGKPLCHADDGHDCYHLWTVYCVRPDTLFPSLELLPQVAGMFPEVGYKDMFSGGLVVGQRVYDNGVTEQIRRT